VETLQERNHIILQTSKKKNVMKMHLYIMKCNIEITSF